MAVDSLRASGTSGYAYITGLTLPDEWWATIKVYAPADVADGTLQPFFFALPNSGGYMEQCLEFNDSNEIMLSNHQGNKVAFTLDAWHTIEIHANGGVWSLHLDGGVALYDSGEIRSANQVTEFDLGNVGFPFGSTDGFYLKDFHVGTARDGSDLLGTTIDGDGLHTDAGNLNTAGTVNAVEGPADGDGDGDAVTDLEPGSPPSQGDQIEDDTDSDAIDAKFGVRTVYVENHAPNRIGDNVVKAQMGAWHKHSELVGNHWQKPAWAFRFVKPGHAPDDAWLITVTDAHSDDYDGIHLWSGDRVLIIIPARNMFPTDDSDLPNTNIDTEADIVESNVEWDADRVSYVLFHLGRKAIPTIRHIHRWLDRFNGRGITTAEQDSISDWWEDAGYHAQYTWQHGGKLRLRRFNYAVTHEIAEAIVNPQARLKKGDGQGRHFFLEVCDPVWPSAYTIDGVTCANWVRKRWFKTGTEEACDHMGLTDSSHHLPISGGFAFFFKSGTWRQYNGPRAGY